MDNVLGYFVFDSEAGWWLTETYGWSKHFHRAKECETESAANEAMEKNHGNYVFACLGSP